VRSERRKRHNVMGLLLCSALVVIPVMAGAEEQAPQAAYDWLSSNIRVLVFGELQDPAHSSQNPDNAFLRLPRYSTSVQLRPDLFADTTYVNWSFKPRVTATATWWRMVSRPANGTVRHGSS